MLETAVRCSRACLGVPPCVAARRVSVSPRGGGGVVLGVTVSFTVQCVPVTHWWGGGGDRPTDRQHGRDTLLLLNIVVDFSVSAEGNRELYTAVATCTDWVLQIRPGCKQQQQHGLLNAHDNSPLCCPLLSLAPFHCLVSDGLS